jgi:hypothetical protein
MWPMPLAQVWMDYVIAPSVHTIMMIEINCEKNISNF